MANREDLLKELLTTDAAFIRKVMRCPSPRKLVSMMKEKGVDLTELEASKILRAINFYDASSNITEGNHPTKISDSDLDQTSGGSVTGTVALGSFLWGVYKDYKKMHEDEKKNMMSPPNVPTAVDHKFSTSNQIKALENIEKTWRQ